MSIDKTGIQKRLTPSSFALEIDDARRIRCLASTADVVFSREKIALTRGQHDHGRMSRDGRGLRFPVPLLCGGGKWYKQEAPAVGLSVESQPSSASYGILVRKSELHPSLQLCEGLGDNVYETSGQKWDAEDLRGYQPPYMMPSPRH